MGYFSDKTLMITGGTGSFGNAVLKRFLDTDIGEIRIFSRDEKKQDDMRKEYGNAKIKFYIGDVRDSRSVQDAIHGVDFIFSAAALKQVPSSNFSRWRRSGRMWSARIMCLQLQSEKVWRM